MMNSVEYFERIYTKGGLKLGISKLYCLERYPKAFELTHRVENYRYLIGLSNIFYVVLALNYNFDFAILILGGILLNLIFDLAPHFSIIFKPFLKLFTAEIWSCFGIYRIMHGFFIDKIALCAFAYFCYDSIILLSVLGYYIISNVATFFIMIFLNKKNIIPLSKINKDDLVLDYAIAKYYNTTIESWIAEYTKFFDDLRSRNNRNNPL